MSDKSPAKLSHEKDPLQLTEFGPIGSDVKKSGGFFARLLRRTKDDSGRSSRSSSPAKASPKRSPSPITFNVEYTDLTNEGDGRVDGAAEGEEVFSKESTPGGSDSSSPASSSSSVNVVPQTRTLSSVLKRLGSILDRRGQTLQAYRDSDFKQYWMPDDTCKDCYECGDKFTTFRRRHHCRICGQIFCSRCCNQEVPGRIFGYTGELRVCTYCSKVVLSYAQQTDASGDLKALREDLKCLANIESEAGSYQEFGRWTPLGRKRSGLEEDNHSRQRSSSLTESQTMNKITPFDITPQSEYRSMETINIERKILTQDSAQLRELWNQIHQPEDGIQMQNHRLRLRTYQNCFTGKELVDWLLSKDKVTTRDQANAIGQALLDAKLIEGVGAHEQVFRDEYMLYKAGMASKWDSPPDLINPTDSIILEDESEPNWTKDIKQEGDDHDSSAEIEQDSKGSTFIGDDDFHCDEEQASMVFYTDTFGSTPPSIGGSAERPKTLRNLSVTSEKSLKEGMDPNYLMLQDSTVSRGINEDILKGALAKKDNAVTEDYPEWWKTIHSKQEHENSVDKLAYERLRKAQYEHMSMLTKQLLSNEGLSFSWAELIQQISQRISEIVCPDIKTDGDDMDIRHYVQIKKVPGGQKMHTNLVQGAVCTKHVAHKKMRQNIKSPRILLLKAAIEYQRIENKFSSLEPQILQEKEFLRNCIAKIASLKPDILMVERTVSRIAQEFLLEAGITLVLNVKPSVMERVARYTQAEVVHSIDGLVSRPRLGLCHNFKINMFELPNNFTKTLMYFDGCASHLGCTVTLRGGSTAELTRVKRILHFMVYVAYHSKLETSFVMDSCGMPPPHPSENRLNLDAVENSSEDSLSSPCKQVVESLESYTDRLKQGSFIAKLVNRPNSGKDESRIEMSGEFSPISTTCPARISTDAGPDVSNGDTGRSNQGDENVAEEALISKSFDEIDGESVIEKNMRKSGKGTASEKRDSALSAIEHVTDLSDPLHHYQQNQDDSVFKSTEGSLKEEVKNYYYKFKKALDDVILSASPYLKFNVPYLLTDVGAKCFLRQFFPEEIYWSAALEDRKENYLVKGIEMEAEERYLQPPLREYIQWVEPHPFIRSTLTKPIFDSCCQTLLADFRARGGQIQLLSQAEIREKKRKERLGVISSLSTPSSGETSDRNSADVCWESKVDCFNAYKHQRIAVLFSSYSYVSANAPNACINPWVVIMEFYGRNDITLGNFLERFCFRDSYVCPSEVCGVPMTDHIRRFVHDAGCIHIVLKRLASAALGYSNNIVMWNWCRKCKKITQPVPMSSETWSMSFAKYLEIRFHGNVYTRRGEAETCQHSLHHNHYQYFGHKQTVAAFKYSHITLKEIVLPPLKVAVEEETTLPDAAFEEVKFLKIRVNETYSTVFEQLCKLKVESNELPEKLINDYMAQLSDEQTVMREHVDSMQSKFTNPRFFQNYPPSPNVEMGAAPVEDDDLSEAHDILFALEDSIAVLKKMMAEAVTTWNAKIQELLALAKKPDRSQKFKPQKEVSSTPDSVEPVCPSPKFSIGNEEISATDADNVSNGPCPTPDADAVSGEFSERSSIEGDILLAGDEVGDDLPKMETSGDHGELHVQKAIEEAMMDSPMGSITNSAKSQSSQEDSYIYSVTPGMNAGIWPQRDGEKSTNSYAVCRLPQAIESKVRAFTDVNSDFVMVRHDSETSIDPCESNATPSCPGDQSNQSPKEDTTVPNQDKPDGQAMSSREIAIPKRSQAAVISEKPKLLRQSTYSQAVGDERTEKKSMKRIISNLLAGPSTKLLHMPFPEDEHHLLPACRKVPVIIYDEEPSSIIAYALSSQDYEMQRQDLVMSFHGNKVDSAQASPASKRKTPTGFDSDSDSQEPEFAFYSVNESEKSKGPNPHIELQFSETNARFYCRVYFAEQFRQLRKLIFPAGEERYIRSLSRCIHWMARGGKSGSAFCKTKDDRFVLKQMSRLEVQSFVDFAPKYFQYMTMAHNEERPTALAKIFGVYRVVFRNSQTNTASKQDLLVIENLFYGRTISQVFDLKGSVRNRLVNTQGKREEDLVLLDENLLKLIVDSPLYIRPHSKTVLTLAITNDTQFLSAHLVMDYSLLVGLDSERKELVIGIIDFIRTFTWDKKLEMVVKSSGLLGGQGKMPTVVSPELYRTRFLEAMDRYFLLVPDRWSGLGRNVDC